MLVPLQCLNQMEMKYPGVLASLVKRRDNAGDAIMTMARKGVAPGDLSTMMALLYWRQYKVIYNFDATIAEEILEQTKWPDYLIPIQFLRKLPYPCIAVHTLPLEVMAPNADKQALETYTGNAFIWINGSLLNAAWEDAGHHYVLTSLELVEGRTIDDCLDYLIERNLSDRFSEKKIQEIKSTLSIDHFGDIQHYGKDEFSKLEKLLGEKVTRFSEALHLSMVREALLQRTIHIILYLNASNADIENAAEKLKAGAWASLLEGEPTEEKISRDRKRRALREHEGATVMDVGYRIGADFRRSYSYETQKDDGNPTGRRMPYHLRRGHDHMFWVGPRNGPLAEDILHPQEGERGLILRWIDAVEVNKELKQDIATAVRVRKQPETGKHAK